MQKAKEFIKSNLRKLELIGSIIGFFTSIFGFLFESISLNVIFSTVLICSILLGIYFWNFVNTKSKTIKYTYLLVLIALIGFTLYQIFISYIYVKPKCDDLESNPVILISKFNISEEDDLPYAVMNELNNNIKVDSIDIMQVDTFINLKQKLKEEDLFGIIKDQCHTKGIFVFGKRSMANKYFDCSIYISKNFLAANNKYSKQNLLHLKNPDNYSFTIENQAKAIAKLILSILYYQIGDYKNCLENTNSLIDIGNNEMQNEDLKEFLEIYKLNCNYFISGTDSTYEMFKKSINNFNNSGILNYNFGLLSLNIGDTANAIKYFNIAKSKIDTLSIPKLEVVKKSPKNKNNFNVSMLETSNNVLTTNKNNLTYIADLSQSDKNISENTNTTKIGLNVDEAKTNNSKGNLYPLKIVKTKNGFTYLQDQRGKRVSEYYDLIKRYKNQLFVVNKQGLWGALDTLGRETHPLYFESARELMEYINY
jgi:hypothetical protein